MMRLRQLLCSHNWGASKGSTPEYMAHVLSFVAMPGSILDKQYLVYWWLTCTKCGKTKRHNWFVSGKGERRELCPHCRGYVSVRYDTKTEYDYLFMGRSLTFTRDVAYCHSCGNETFNPERDRKMRSRLLASVEEGK